MRRLPLYLTDLSVAVEKISPLGTLPSQFEGDIIMTEIDRLREYRCMMVQRSEQVIFVYNVLRRALSAGA